MAETAPATVPAASTPQEHVLEIIRGFWESRALAIATELDIAELLADGPLSVEVLAKRSNTHELSLYLLLRALESIGVFKQVSPRVFANTPSSNVLRRNVAGSQWAFVRLCLSAGLSQYDAWAGMMNSIRTGNSAFQEMFGAPIWEYNRTHPEVNAVFNEAMRSGSAAITPAVVSAYDWSQFPVVADLGGGIGTQLAAILEAHPSVHGILFDRASVLAEAIPHSRMEARVGNFFESVPEGADAYTMRWILHDWQDAEAVAILRNIRKAMKPESRVVLIEEIIPEGPELCWPKWLDLHMLAVPGGRERTAAEYAALFAQAGLDGQEIVPTTTGASLIIARPRT